MKEGTIRPMALCIVKFKGKILVMDGYDPKKDQVFYRLLGGGIELGEYAKQALEREFQEELATDLENIKFIKVLENIFTFKGKQGHEITFIFEADLASKELYNKNEMAILDAEGETTVSWQKISDFKDNKLILYPEGIASEL